MFLNPLELKLDLDRWDCSRRSACQQVFTEFRQRQQLGRAVAVGSGRRLENFEVEYRAVRARDAATKARHRRPLRRVVVHREEQAAQQRAPVDAVSHVAVAPEAQRTTCHSHDQVLLVVQVPARRASRALWRLSSRRGSYAGTHRRAGCSRSEESTCGRHLRRRP